MPAEQSAFSYAILRVVPDMQRGEFINAGVVLFARQHGFLAAKVGLDREKLRAIDPRIDLDAAEAALDAAVRVAAGEADAGPIAALDQSERFGWLTAPASALVQASPTHTGLCDDPQRALEELFADLVG